MIIGITGTNGAGKGTVVEILMRDLGFKHYSARGYLNKILTEQGKELTRPNMSQLANSLRAANHPAILAEKLLEEAQKDGGLAIIESIRTPGEAELLRKFDNFQLLAVTADSKTRYERAVLRGSSTDKISYDQFKEQEEVEMSSTDPNKQNIAKCIQLSDAVLQNDTTVDKLQAQLYEYLAKLGIHAQDIPVTQVAKIIRLHVSSKPDALALDALVKGPAFAHVRSQPGFVSVTRTVCKAELAYEVSVVFDSGDSFTSANGAEKGIEAEFVTAAKKLAVDGKIYVGNRVHDQF